MNQNNQSTQKIQNQQSLNQIEQKGNNNGSSQQEQEEFEVEDLFLDMAPDVIIKQQYQTCIFGTILKGIDRNQILKGIKKFEQAQTLDNLSIYDICVNGKQQDKVCKKMLNKISQCSWISIEFLRCKLPQKYYNKIFSYDTKYLLFHNSNVINPKMHADKVQQLTFNNTNIREGNGDFLKHYPKLKYVFTANEQEGNFLRQKVKQFNLSIAVNVNKIFYK